MIIDFCYLAAAATVSAVVGGYGGGSVYVCTLLCFPSFDFSGVRLFNLEAA